MQLKYTMGALKAAKKAQEHVVSNNYIYHADEAALSIDEVLGLPELIAIVDELVDEAKRDLAATPNWTGNTVRINRSRLKELANRMEELRG